jgi:pyruvate dehydrogenase E2 component (dihydrolipoamide acetyltransferase)
MRQKILMPKLGLTMTEGQVVEWLVAVGSPFKAEDGLFVVETEKVATEVPAEADGVLAEITVGPGQAVNVGDVVGYWQAAGDASDKILAGVKKAVLGAVPPPMSLAPVAGLVASVTPTAPDGTRVPVTPLARRLAQQLDVSLANIAGSGPGRRIKAADVQAAAAVIAAAARPLPVAASAPLEQASRSTPTSVQATIARRLAAAKQQVPHFYLAVDAQVSRLLKLRADLTAMDGMARLTLNHFIVAAVGRALLDLPDANRVWSDDAILSFSGTDVGVAVTTERGLFVPVVRDAGRVPLMEVARRARAQVEQARNGRLTANDISGGAITVSNAGMFNVKYMTSIINPGQAMILGVGSISQAFRPDADGRPELRDEMGLVLACDHRILDGVSGLKFLNCVVAYLEQPMKLLLNA